MRIDKQSVCGCCGVPASKICTGCTNMRYCSRDHQIEDWRIHKSLCKSFANFQERPGDGYRRVIVLPEDSKKPCFAWIPMYDEEASPKDDNGPEAESSRNEGEQAKASMSEQDEVSSRNQGEDGETSTPVEAVEMGWEDARANPTGYDEPDTVSMDGRSDTSFSTIPASIEHEKHSNHSVRLRWRGTCNSDGLPPNNCVASLTNALMGTHFRGPLELYGTNEATGSCVDLDTTFLTLAVKLLLILGNEQGKALIEDRQEEPGAEAAILAEKVESTRMDGHGVSNCP